VDAVRVQAVERGLTRSLQGLEAFFSEHGRLRSGTSTVAPGPAARASLAMMRDQLRDAAAQAADGMGALSGPGVPAQLRGHEAAGHSGVRALDHAAGVVEAVLAHGAAPAVPVEPVATAYVRLEQLRRALGEYALPLEG
jgi:hypothetical protein